MIDENIRKTSKKENWINILFKFSTKVQKKPCEDALKVIYKNMDIILHDILWSSIH